eukprot:TRINITY_DN118_c14_g1_i1.p1 TRINITY_DN118_c14_g1~~TRINITY_DN118_c14_g1_i1.p1  ORF type:complete len:415 (+),score=70.92 TRINITY_DN118_c14_g1_i1:56-1300(+)
MTSKGIMCAVCGDIRNKDMCCVAHVMESEEVKEARRKRVIASEIMVATGGKGLRMVYYNRWVRFARESKSNAQLKRFREEVHTRRAQRLELELERAILIADLQDSKKERFQLTEKNESLARSLVEASEIISSLQSELSEARASARPPTRPSVNAVAHRALSVIIACSDKETTHRYFNALRRHSFKNTIRRQLSTHYSIRLDKKNTEVQHLMKGVTKAKQELIDAKSKLVSKQRACDSLQEVISSSRAQLESLKKELSGVMWENKRMGSEKRLLSLNYLKKVSQMLLRRTRLATMRHRYSQLRVFSREKLLSKVKALCKTQRERIRVFETTAAKQPTILPSFSVPHLATPPVTPLSGCGLTSDNNFSFSSSSQKSPLGIRTFNIPKPCRSYDNLLHEQITLVKSIVCDPVAEVEL